MSKEGLVKRAIFASANTQTYHECLSGRNLQFKTISC